MNSSSKTPKSNPATDQFLARLHKEPALRRAVLDEPWAGQLLSSWRSGKHSPSIAKIDAMLAKMSCKLAIVPLDYDPARGHQQVAQLQERILRLEELLRAAQQKLRNHADIRPES